VAYQRLGPKFTGLLVFQLSARRHRLKLIQIPCTKKRALPSLIETPMERPFLFGTGSLVMWQRIRSMFAPAEPPAGDPPRSRITIVSILLEDQDRSLLAKVSQANQWDVVFAKTCDEARLVSEQIKPQIILVDRDLAEGDWRQSLLACASSSGACTMLISRVADDYLWNEVVSNGGYDVLRKPLREQDVLRAVKFAWSYWNSARRAAASAKK
jgi:hypothetical protein